VGKSACYKRHFNSFSGHRMEYWKRFALAWFGTFLILALYTIAA